MRKTLFIALPLLLACLSGCGGGGSQGGSSQPTALSFSASPTTIQVAGSSQTPLMNVSVVLTLAGTVPATGLFYGWNNTTNMIAAINGSQTGTNEVTLDITLASPTDTPIGVYQDTIEVKMALDQAGQRPIVGSPQTIQVTYRVENPAGSLAQMSPASACAGGPGFLLTVTGQGFTADAQVQWNGAPLATSFVSSTTLTAQVPTSAIALPGSALVTVSAQDLATSAALYMPIGNAQTLLLEGGLTCAWDPVHGLLYTCLLNGNTGQVPAIQAIDPATGKVVAQTICGSNAYPPISGPNGLAVSDDGGYLYVSGYNLQPGAPASILRYLLPALTLDPTFSCGLPFGAQDWVMRLAVAPGAPRTLAVALGNQGNAAGVAILDDGQLRGSILFTPTPPVSGNALIWGTDAATLYVLSGTWNAYQLSTVAVPASGPVVRVTQPVAMGQDPWDLHWVPATGYLYAGSGQVIDPATGKVVGTCASGTAQDMDMDLGLGLGFYLTTPSVQPSALTWGVSVTTVKLATFGAQTSTFVPVGRVATGSLPPPTRVLRCGPSTLVLYGGSQFQNPIYILSGPFAKGQ
jgi:hypothetical protein